VVCWVNAWLCRNEGDLDAAALYLDEANTLAECVGDPRMNATVQFVEALCRYSDNAHPQALDLLKQAVDTRLELGDQRGAAYALLWATRIHSESGHLAEATASIAQAVGIVRSSEDQVLAAFAAEVAAELMLAQHHSQHAAALFQAAAVLRQRLNAPVAAADRDRLARKRYTLPQSIAEGDAVEDVSALIEHTKTLLRV